MVAFTATQIPGIDDRRYPPELAGPLYLEGIPIYPESELEHLVKDYHVDRSVINVSYFHIAILEDYLRICCRQVDIWGSQVRVCLAQVRPGVLGPVRARRHGDHVPRAVLQGRLRDSVPPAHHAAQHQACKLPLISVSTSHRSP